MAPDARKAVYVCPTCGHESPVDGDWLVAERPVRGVDRLVYGCPVCGQPVTAGPTVEDRRAGRAGAADRGPVAASVSHLDGLAAAVRRAAPRPAFRLPIPGR